MFSKYGQYALPTLLLAAMFAFAVSISPNKSSAVESPNPNSHYAGFDTNNPNSGANSRYYDGKREVEPEDFGQGVVRYGKNVFYFAHTGASYGNALAAFLDKHAAEYDGASAVPHFKTVNEGRNGVHQECVGYFVTFHERPKS